MHNFTQTVKGHYENDKYIFFWSGPFSNWWPCSYSFGDLVFNCSEQQFIAHKALLFGDLVAYSNIMISNSPRAQKEAGRKVKNFDEVIWNKNKYLALQLALYLKFNQNTDLKKILLNTGDKTLVEASPYDTVYGIGMGVEHRDILDESKWKGENLLGKGLMAVRKILRTEFDEIVYED